MEEIAEAFAQSVQSSIGAPLTVMLIAMIPIFEARLAILVGMSIGLSPGEAFGYAFLGSSLMAPILLIVLIPIVKTLAKTKFFSKIGKFLYDKFEKKSRTLVGVTNDNNDGKQKKKFALTKSDLKKMGGTAGFVAIPIPLTGVWTGSAVASIIGVGFVKGLIGIIVGNAVACGIITLIGFLFYDYLTWITVGFAAVAVIIIVVLIVKLIMYKPQENGAASEKSAISATNNDETSASTPSSEYTITTTKNDSKSPQTRSDRSKEQ